MVIKIVILNVLGVLPSLILQVTGVMFGIITSVGTGLDKTEVNCYESPLDICR